MGSVSEMPELLADFKVAYATTEPRLRVDVRMFSLYLIWMPTRAVASGPRLFSAQSLPPPSLVASAGSVGGGLNCLTS